jgi:hypothetical protein
VPYVFVIFQQGIDLYFSAIHYTMLFSVIFFLDLHFSAIHYTMLFYVMFFLMMIYKCQFLFDIVEVNLV